MPFQILGMMAWVNAAQRTGGFTQYEPKSIRGPWDFFNCQLAHATYQSWIMVAAAPCSSQRQILIVPQLQTLQ